MEKSNSVYTTPLRFVSPFFLFSIVKILLLSKNHSKVLHRSVPDLLLTLDFPGVRHIPDYFSYHQQSAVIFAPRDVPGYSDVM